MPSFGTVKRLGPFFLLFAIAASCGGDDSKKLQDLTVPTYGWRHFAGNCDSMRIVDAAGNLWETRGCEGGEISLNAAGKVRDLSAVVVAFGDLPCDPPI